MFIKIFTENQKGDNLFILNLKTLIWKAALKVIRPTLLFGYDMTDFYGNSDAKFLKKVDLDTTDVNELKRAHGNMHNGFLQVLVSSGIIAFICTLMQTLYFDDKYVGRVVGGTLSFVLIGLVIYLRIMIKGAHFFDKKQWRYALKISLPLIPHYLGSISYLYLKKVN
ncbi:hypothetical protein EfmGK961_19620 [Enterococcus faecium]|nr:hypothetical protein EfmGK961_19620 [Enterococcus faecium]